MMNMHELLLAFACISCMGAARRVQPSIKRLQNGELVESQVSGINSGRGSDIFTEETQQKGHALAEPAAAFKPAAGARLRERSATNANARPVVLGRGSHLDSPPVMSMSGTLTRKPKQQAHSEGSPAYELLMHTPTKTRARVDRIQTPLGTLDEFGIAPLGMASDPATKSSLARHHIQSKKIQAQVKGMQKELEPNANEQQSDKVLSKLEQDRLQLEEIYRREDKSSETKVEGNQMHFKGKKSEGPSAEQRRSGKAEEQVETSIANAHLQVRSIDANYAKRLHVTVGIASMIMATALTFIILLHRRKEALHPSPLKRRESEESARIEEDMLERGQSVAAEATAAAEVTAVAQSSAGEEAKSEACMKADDPFLLDELLEEQAAADGVGHKAVVESTVAPAEAEVITSLGELVDHAQKADAMEGLEDVNAVFHAAFAAAQAAEKRKATADAKRNLLRLLRLRNRPRRRRRLRLLQMLRRMRLRLERVLRMQRRRMFNQKRHIKEPKPLTGGRGNGRGPPRSFTLKIRPTQRYCTAMLNLLRLIENVRRARKARRRTR
mmetsp:Transcript_125650/g.222634  ORF Transcript_125650/g.222634 Transcript_125650/m.222634 type:complete len:555 (+) Transcript_125650:78-1742(+)